MLSMKKIITFIMAILYMGISSGMAMEIHYCMGKKAGVDFYGTGNDKCGKCGMKENKSSCCGDVHQFVKLNDAHQAVTNQLVFGLPDLAISHSFISYLPVFPNPSVTNADYILSPPDDTRPAACIMNCVFRL
jgi:hypothetical protein